MLDRHKRRLCACAPQYAGQVRRSAVSGPVHVKAVRHATETVLLLNHAIVGRRIRLLGSTRSAMVGFNDAVQCLRSHCYTVVNCSQAVLDWVQVRSYSPRVWMD